VYADYPDGGSILWSGGDGHDDLDIQRGWKILGANYKDN
jgi:hypothetical protein